ncbi:glycosyltransferase family 4 protein [Chromohalobacter japonicus]|uniref:glycosyltransferase family 4 protein n=1 Tax=Chromohalobacter japonicus TaxID=223900 RepID=UPI0006947C64|nr:glycosyltransferase family 4 protein [Chromohalobacter japonicus]
MPLKHPEPRLHLDDIKLTIWLTRPDLQDLFDGDYARFEWWLVVAGGNEYQALRELPPAIDEARLTRPAPGALETVTPTFTQFMCDIWSSRPDLQQVFDLETGEDQQKLVNWYFLNGLRELKLTRFITQQQRLELETPVAELPKRTKRPSFSLAHWWRKRTQGHRQESLPTITWIMAAIWRQRADLQQQFDLAKPVDRKAFVDWFNVHGQLEYRLIETEAKQPSVYEGPLPFGLNLIGYAKGQFGIGEDVRMAALACEAVGIPFSIYNVEPGEEVTQNDDSAMAHVSSELPYSINLFCTTAIETARLAAVEGSKLFEGRYCIGYWPWELPEWPQAWHHVYNLVDEVWASSRYAYQAFAGSSPKPVRHMPMAVSVEPTAGRCRADFGLPQEPFLFVFSFDFLSSLARKNPQACVEAFRQAFPKGDEPVGLVVKAMRASEDNALWQRLMELAEADGRIHVINETLSRGEVLDLYRACDCFVSLHRSEGFGRGIAEAMLLGKAVITTGHSGNMDFTTPGTAALVDHTLVPLAEDEYPFGEGQHWAEPSIEHAAWWMQRIATQPELRQRQTQAAQALMNATYLPRVVGEHYQAMLEFCQPASRNSDSQKTQEPACTLN